jgi:hypothetical protein
VDDQAQAECGKRSFDLLHARSVTQVEHADSLDPGIPQDLLESAFSLQRLWYANGLAARA